MEREGGRADERKIEGETSDFRWFTVLGPMVHIQTPEQANTQTTLYTQTDT